MRLHEGQVEAQLRRAARKAVRASPHLTAEARRHRKQHRRQWTSDEWLLRLLATGCVLVLVGVAPGSVQGVPGLAFEYGVAIFAFWGLLTSLSGAARLSSLLAGDQERVPLLLLPITDYDIFRRQSGKYLRLTTWSFVQGAAAYGWLMVGLSGWGGRSFWVLVPLLALAHWLLTLALSMIIAQRPAWLARTAVLLIAIWGAFLVMIFDRRFVGPWLATQLAEASDWIVVVLPTGWPAVILEGVMRQQWSWIIVLIPLGLLLWIGRTSWIQLARDFVTQDLDSSTRANTAETEFSDEWQREGGSAPRGPTALIEQIHAREFLQPAQIWDPQDRLERLANRWLNSREQLLAEVTIHFGLGWSRRWWKGLAILAVGSLGAWGLQAAGFRLFGWVDALVLLMVAATTLPTHVSSDPQLVGLLPIDLKEMLRLRTKLWLIRSLSAVPLFAAAGAVLAWRLGHSALTGFCLGLKASLLLQAFFPYASLLGTGVSHRQVDMRSLGYLCFLLCCVGTTSGLALGTVAPEFLGRGSWLGWVCLPGAILAAWGFAAFYVWQFNRGRLDLPVR